MARRHFFKKIVNTFKGIPLIIIMLINIASILIVLNIIFFQNEYVPAETKTIFKFLVLGVLCIALVSKLISSYLSERGASDDSYWKRRFHDTQEAIGELNSKLDEFKSRETIDIDIKDKEKEMQLLAIQYKHIWNEFHRNEDLINTQINRLVKNSNLNLIIAVVTTIIAMGILGITLFQDKTYSSLSDFFIHFGPRVSTVVFIELFAFFFLKLYKNNQSEVKYCQNELTNLKGKIVALQLAVDFKDPEAIRELIRIYSSIERNSIIKSGETTEKIELSKIESKSNTGYLKSISEFFSKEKSN